MQEHEKTIWSLLVLGALIAIGKALNSDDPITPRLFIGRMILGAGTSMMAGAALIWIPGLSSIAVVGLGSALGIAGHQVIEVWLKRRGSRLLARKIKSTKLSALCSGAGESEKRAADHFTQVSKMVDAAREAKSAPIADAKKGQTLIRPFPNSRVIYS